MIPLLPYEKFLASQLGIPEEKYQEFKAIALRYSVEHPADYPRAGGGILITALINLAIGIGLSLLSALLFPTEQRKTPKIKQKEEGGQNLTSNQRLSPRFGFDAVQEPAKVGQPIPVIIAKRENGYGGVRLALPMVWSQMLSFKGGQLFRGIFLAGIANMSASAWDPRGWAFGNNTLGVYSFFGVGDEEGGRYSIYYRRGGGRIRGGDKIAGRRADLDPGNSEPQGGPDVFALRGRGGAWESAFCMSEPPSTSRVFGLYGWCPNGMLARAAVRIQPTIRARINSDDEVRTDDDASALCEFWKGKRHWSMRAGLRQYRAFAGDWIAPAGDGYDFVNQAVQPGDQLSYDLERETDTDTKIKFTRVKPERNMGAEQDDDDGDSELEMTEIGALVASAQNSADASLVPGELYKIGTAWAVLETRIPRTDTSKTIFISDQENEPPGHGNSMSYVFTVVKAGTVQLVGSSIFNQPEQGTTIFPPRYFYVEPADDSDYDPSPMSSYPSGTEGRYRVCSAAPQVFRMALASIASVREVKIMEIGLKSRVGISINNMTEYRSCPTLETINDKAGQTRDGKDANGKLVTSIYTSNTLTDKVLRYSTFRMVYRSISTDWVDFPQLFAVASISGEDVYNYLRIEFPSAARWEARFEPISSWEIRSQGISSVLVLDSTGTLEVSTPAAGVTVTSTGYYINPSDLNTRLIRQLEPKQDIGLNWSDYSGLGTVAYPTMIDGYAHFAEAFCYSNVQSTVDTSPEHEIVYVNYPSDLDKSPSYECLATVGVNLAASLEFTNLQQFSGFCNNGYEMRQLLAADAVGSTHLFPDWLRELMTSTEVGPSPPIPDIQIDRTSFEEAAQWCQDRNYFYDAAEAEPLNIIQWASDTAQAHLLKFVRIGGIYHLKKAIEFDNPLPIAGLFTNGNMVEESFALETVDYESRQPFFVEVKWREETTDFEAPLFPRERIATVAETGTPSTAPTVTLDLSKWCTNYQQAIDAACYLIRFRRLADHRIRFQTTPDIMAARLEPGSIIKVAVDVTNYDKAVQGFITASGSIASTRPDLAPTADGSYSALLWDGSGEPVESSITISGGVASPASHFFAIASADTQFRTYEVKRLPFSADGIITVEAFHHPLDGSDMSLLGVNWTTYQTDANWTISF